MKLCNAVKFRKLYPTIFQPSNITSLYKNKGEKADLNNDRGIFNVVKIRSILDKLIYNEKYEIIDKNMSSSNIGGRKHRNIRDHLFVINAILQDASKDKMSPIDVQIYDIKNALINCGLKRHQTTYMMLESLMIILTSLQTQTIKCSVQILLGKSCLQMIVLNSTSIKDMSKFLPWL